MNTNRAFFKCLSKTMPTLSDRLSPRATLTLVVLSNLPCASKIRLTHASHEPIVKFLRDKFTQMWQIVARALVILNPSPNTVHLFLCTSAVQSHHFELLTNPHNPNHICHVKIVTKRGFYLNLWWQHHWRILHPRI